jgi:hypothetical protein
MLSRSPSGCFVAFLAKNHVFRGESSHLYKKLASGRALHTPVKQPPISAGATLGRASRRADVFLTPFPFSTVLALPALLNGQVEFLVFHLILPMRVFSPAD